MSTMQNDFLCQPQIEEMDECRRLEERFFEDVDTESVPSFGDEVTLNS